MSEFSEPSCVIVKHTNPCGVSSSGKINMAYKKALDSDKKSSFGGVVLLNRKINIKLAKELSKHFFELIAAPDFDREALKLLKLKKNLILLKLNKIKISNQNFRSTIFGTLFQSNNDTKIDTKILKLKTLKKIKSSLKNELVFATKVVKHLKSNAVVLSHNKQTLGIGCGQTNRIDALNTAIKNFKKNFKSSNFVCASDGFFPFTDSVKLLKKNNCRAIAQPSGSINDKKIIDYAKNNKMTLFHIKNRLFKH